MLPTIAFTLLSLLLVTQPAAAAPRPLIPIERSLAGRAVANSFIVGFKSTANIAADRRPTWLNNTLTRAGLSVAADTDEATNNLKWSRDVFDGFGATLTTAAVNTIRAHKDVAYVVEDTIMHTTETIQQTNAPWGLARLSQREPLGVTDPNGLVFNYLFDSTGGEGVDVYVVDTGVRVTHADFGGRATFGVTFGSGAPGEDRNGHGTHCAGTIAGSTLGVAKKASIIGVKVMSDDGSGATRDIISGINFAVTSAASAGNRPSIISMSLGGPGNRALDDAAAGAVAAGVHVIVAAGNESVDAVNSSPARAPQVVTVGAVDIQDRVAGFSNFGAFVDVFAPGVSITSAGIASDVSLKVLSGTSMACPHVAGLAATLLTQEGVMTPAQLQARIKELASNNILARVPTGTVNALAFNNALSPVPVE